MRETWVGSGIDAKEVDYYSFQCENDECGEFNEDGDTVTDDLGYYSIDCEFCGHTYRESSLKEDRDSYYADMDDER
jgi:hypothetical protein